MKLDEATTRESPREAFKGLLAVRGAAGGGSVTTLGPRWLPALTIACAMLAIANGSWALDHRALLFIFKPLTTALIIAHAWSRGTDTPAQRRYLLAGLWFSLVGDVALLWPQQGFVPNIGAA